MKRFFNKTSISQIGTVACVGLCLIILASTIFSLVSGYINDKENINTLITPSINGIINVLFYFIVSGYFTKSKKNFGFAYNAMIILLLSDFVIPFVFQLFEGIIFDPLNIVSFLFGSVFSLGVGIAYFIIMLIDNKYGGTKKALSITLLILGIILFVFSFVSSVTTIITCSFMFNTDLLNNIGIIISIIYVIFSFLATSLYFFFPLYLRRYRKLGF